MTRTWGSTMMANEAAALAVERIEKSRSIMNSIRARYLNVRMALLFIRHKEAGRDPGMSILGTACYLSYLETDISGAKNLILKTISNELDVKALKEWPCPDIRKEALADFADRVLGRKADLRAAEKVDDYAGFY